MATARTIIRNTLTFGLNRLSPGEAEDADVFHRCLDALNEITDELTGGGSTAFKEVLTDSTAPITGATGTLGTDWSVPRGTPIRGATATDASGVQIVLEPITMAQYMAIGIKAVDGAPEVYAHDGDATVYFYPRPVGETVTLRTLAPFSEFVDLDTVYHLPPGYASAFSALLAERMAPSIAPGLVAATLKPAQFARLRLAAFAVRPAILGAIDGASSVARITRGY